MPSLKLIVLSLVLIGGSTVFFHSLQSDASPSFWSRAPSTKSAHAFATFLANYSEGDAEFYRAIKDNEPDNAYRDGYFLGIRVLNYALNHHPATRNVRPNIPFLVLVTEDVSPYKRARLAADGMTVLEMPKIELPDWMIPAASRYKDVMTKLSLWKLTGYRKICFIDADTLLVAPIDGVFDDPVTDLRRTLADKNNVPDNERTPPRHYLFAAREEAASYDHELPPDPHADYLNSGFFVFAPSLEMYEYYMSLATQSSDRKNEHSNDPDLSFDGRFPEQNVLNYAHRPEGNMPWQHLNWKWNMGWPTERDVDAGVRSFHAKFWDDDPGNVEALRDVWTQQRWRMEGYTRARDEYLLGKEPARQEGEQIWQAAN